MSTPVGHTLVGLTLARRLGVTSPLSLAATVVAASLPDADVLAGLALHGDAWKLHRKATHTLPFTVAVGFAAGVAGVIRVHRPDGRRDVIADGLAGALLVTSHLVMDRTPFPYFPTKKTTPKHLLMKHHRRNWTVDGAVFGYVAWRCGLIGKRKPH